MEQTAQDTSRISFTALYTGHVWNRNGLSDPVLSTPRGKLLYRLLSPLNALSDRLAPGLTLETMLLQRHQLIDHFLRQAVAEQGVQQVLEVAAGLSPRGIRIRKQYPDLHYIEADLPGIAARKRNLLENAGYLSDHHQVIECNALALTGPGSLAEIVSSNFDTSKPLAIITEGLINYFSETELRTIWTGIANALRQCPSGLYFSDISKDLKGHPGAQLIYTFKLLLEVATRGRTHMHFTDNDACIAALLRAGFDNAQLHDPAEYYDLLKLPRTSTAPVVNVIRATTGPIQ